MAMSPENAEKLKKRYDKKARSLLEAATTVAVLTNETATIPLAAWNALVEGLSRDLMVGDVLLFAQEHPAKTLEAAGRLYSDRDFMRRANAGE